MALVPATSRGLAASGGTVTGTTKVLLSPDPGASAGTALVVEGDDDNPNANVIEAYDSNQHLGFAVQQSGGANGGLYAEDRAGSAPVLYLNSRAAGPSQDILSIVRNFAEQGGFDASGYFYTKRVAAPADAGLAASQLMLWLDDTVDGTAIGLKAKDSGGTIRTSKYPLRQSTGALPTVAPTSGVAFQCSATQDVVLSVPVTYNPSGILTATCKVELSPDGATFSTLVTVTLPALAALAGLVSPVVVAVPAGWRVKLTATNATLGTGTYY